MTGLGGRSSITARRSAKRSGFASARSPMSSAGQTWLQREVCPVELSEDRVRDALLRRCRSERVEPPGASRIERVLGSARAGHDAQFTARTLSRLSDGAELRLAPSGRRRAGHGGLGGGSGFLAELKADPGRVGLRTLLEEIEKLERVRAIGLPGDLFADASERQVTAWRARAAKLYPSDLRAAGEPVRLTLLAALCWSRTAEITDALVDLLIELVHGIGTRAENRVERELINDLRRVRGKQGILFRLAEAAIEHPDDTVRAALFPVVGEGTLRDLVREAKANDQAFRQRVRTVLRASYSSHYRRMLPRLLAAWSFAARTRATARSWTPWSCWPGTPSAPARTVSTPPRRPCPSMGSCRASGGRGHRRQRPDRAHPVRAVRPACPQRRDPAPRDLRRRRQPLARPRRRPADRLRRQPRHPLRRAASATGPQRVHHRPAGPARRRTEQPRRCGRRWRRRRCADHQPSRGAVDHGPGAGRPARAADAGGAQAGGHASLGDV